MCFFTKIHRFLIRSIYCQPGIQNMKKVLQIVNYYYPHIGGTEQVAYDIASVLKGCPEVEQKIICFNGDAGSMETAEDVIDGITVIRCGCIARIASQSISLSYPEILDAVMSEFSPDIVFFHYPNPYLAHFLLKHRKEPFRLFIYWHLDITRQKMLKKMFRGETLKLIDRAEKILGATPVHLYESEFSAAFGDKGCLLPYMIDRSFSRMSDDERALAREIRERDKGKTICFAIGRHVEYKGIRYLIEASGHLDDSFRIYIAGTGKLTAELKKLAGEENKIVFLGNVTDAERKAYFNACDIFCFPSVTRNEAFGLALAEAMSCGKPAVTFRIKGSGVNYLNINGVTGIECPNRNSLAFARAIIQLAEHGELREMYGEAARKRISGNFSREAFESGLIRLIE